MWASTHCANAEFVMKVDDDVFVNAKNLLRAIVKYADDLQISIGGLCLGITTPSRKVTKYYYEFPFTFHTFEEKHKHDVPYEEYLSYTYPPYCSGTGYIASSKVAKDIIRYKQFWNVTLSAKRGCICGDLHQTSWIQIDQHRRIC